jgi:hypothetical protein
LEQGQFHGNGISEVECSDCGRLKHLDFICNYLTNLDFVRDIPSLTSIYLVSNPHVPIAKEYLLENGQYGQSWRNCLKEVREYLAGSEL